MVAETQHRQSQRETQLVPDTQPETQLSSLSQLSKTPSVEIDMSSSEDSSKDSSDNPEPRRSGRIKRPTRDAASQDRAAALAAAKSPKGKKVRKAKLMNTSQLLDEFALE
jgi:hypothetical protein